MTITNKEFQLNIVKHVSVRNTENTHRDFNPRCQRLFTIHLLEEERGARQNPTPLTRTVHSVGRQARGTDKLSTHHSVSTLSVNTQHSTLTQQHSELILSTLHNTEQNVNITYSSSNWPNIHPPHKSLVVTVVRTFTHLTK